MSKLNEMDKNENEMADGFSTDLNNISKHKCEAVDQKDDENLTQNQPIRPENNEVVSLIHSSSGKRKLNSISDDASNNEPSLNSRTDLFGSNLSCGSNEVNLDTRACFKGRSKKFKQDLGSKKGNFGMDKTPSAAGGIIEEITRESNVSSLLCAASEKESQLSGKERNRHFLNEGTNIFLESEKAIKKAGFGSKKNFYFPKSDKFSNYKKFNTISGMESKDGPISSRKVSPVSCGNEEREVNVEETLNTKENATADGAGPSGYVQEKGNKNGFACSVCDKEFTESWEFDAHYQTSHKDKDFVCNICKIPFSNKYHLDRYYRKHTGEKPFVCELCNKGFFERGDLNRHGITHTRQKPHVCEICNKGFTQKGSLYRHSLTHSEKPYFCDVCNKGYPRIADLNRHSITHSCEKPYVCEKCNKGFYRKEDLKRHSITHTREKLYVCDICDKGFTQQGTLNRYYIIHTGKKPFVCEVCKKEFTQKENLNRHSTTHFGGKSYVCDVCNKEFTQKGNLDRHYRIHDSEKSFRREICTEDFADQRDSEKNICKHTRKPFGCSFCGKTYLNSRSLRRHHKEKHQ